MNNRTEIQDYADWLLKIAVSKCGSIHEAGDLTQETLLSAIVYEKRSGKIENMKAWLSTVLNRKYNDMLRRKYNKPTVTIGEGFDIPCDFSAGENMESSQEAENVRREVAYLSQMYREIIVRRYFYGRSDNQIAAELGIPVGTVKSRLNFGRKQIKKGLDNMENYVSNSYAPQQMHLRNSGRFGMNMEPMSLCTDDDILTQNLLMLAYEKPLTASELSRKIGIPTAYVEPIIDKLVNGELMRMTGDGRVYTDFIIYERDDFTKYQADAEKFCRDIWEIYGGSMKSALEKLRGKEYYSERLERFFIINLADRMYGYIIDSASDKQYYPDRPNGGKWLAFGEKVPPFEWECKYLHSGCRSCHIEEFIGGKDLWMYNYETVLYKDNKFEGLGYSGITSFMETETDMLKMFYLIKKGIDFADVDLDTRIVKAIPKLVEHGFLVNENGTIEVAVPVLTSVQWSDMGGIRDEFLNEIKNSDLAVQTQKYFNTHRKTVPKHLKSVQECYLVYPYSPKVMNFVYEALERGIHKEDLGYNCPETVVVFD